LTATPPYRKETFMAVPAHRLLLRIALPLLALATLSGCATRYDSEGRRIYFLQFGQPTYNAIDYSNPRLPQLPRTRPTEILWEVPSPYQFLDLSRYSMVVPSEPLASMIAAVGDNAGCAASCESNAPGALVVSRADARHGDQSSNRN
jgi:hypothetical protein